MGLLDRLRLKPGPRRHRGDVSASRAGAFVVFQPETAGARVSGVGPLAVSVFDTWLGDDLIRVHPALLVTTPLKEALAASDLSGFAITRSRVRSSAFWRRYNPSRRLPLFWSLEVRGTPGVDDFGRTEDGLLVVSWRALETIVPFEVGRAVFSKYAPLRPTRRRDRDRD